MKTIRMSSSQFRESLSTPRTNRSNTGKPFEREIEAACRHYQERGIALIEKVEPPTRIVGDRVIHLRNPFLDYIGVIVTMGIGTRPILIEAKSTKTHLLALCSVSRKTLAEGKHGLTLTQWESMNRWDRVGALVLLLWKFNGQIRRIKVDEIEKEILAGLKTLRFEECGEIVGEEFLEGIV